MRNFFLLFFSVLLLASCQSQKKYWASDSNPYSLAVKVYMDTTVFYTNQNNGREISFCVINHSDYPFTLPSPLSENVRIAGYPRFYDQPRYYKISESEWMSVPEMSGKTIAPHDSVRILFIPMQTLLGSDDNVHKWFKNSEFKRNTRSPLYETVKKSYAYGRLQLQLKVGDRWIISDEVRVAAMPFKENTSKSKAVDLTIDLVDEPEYKTDGTSSGILRCRVKNKTNYNISFYNDPGSIRFVLYGYSPNRTSIMRLEFKVAGNRSVMDAVVVKPGEEKSIFEAPINQVLYTSPGGLPWYWTWNRKKPPVSPFVYRDGKYPPNVELWFGVVVDGKEHLSNPLIVPVRYVRK